MGFTVEEAPNGKEGISKVQPDRPDLILLDLVMPGMDGLETLKRLKDLPDMQDVVIIIFSAAVFEQTRRDIFDAGANDFLTKPFQIDEFLEKLEAHLNLRWKYRHEDQPEQSKRSV